MGVAKVEILLAEHRLIHLEFLGIDVVGEDHAPPLAFQRETDQPNPGEELHCPVGCRDRASGCPECAN